MTRSIHRLAEGDLSEAFRFYRREGGKGIAARFLSEFERIARLLEQHPGLGTPTEGGRRVHPLVGFPYSIIYREDQEGIRILVVRHQHRDPEFGKGRE